jgi:MFS family permease
MPPREPLFTARFFLMCGFSFTVFVSAFMLFPTAPYRIISLGGTESVAGWFLGLLTYFSAVSAPITGAIADRIGKKRMLVVCSVAITGFSTVYALTATYPVMLAFVPFHGVFWSGLLSASAAYMTDLVPESRRAEGIGYWGLSTIFAVMFAPSLGFFLYRHGWLGLCAVVALLNVVMAVIASRLQETHVRAHPPGASFFGGGLVEWRVMLASISLFLYSYGYGAITSFSALYADARGVTPKGIYFGVLAFITAVTRPITGPLGDKLGHRKVLLPCLALIAAGLALLALPATRTSLALSAVVFGIGFGSAYPAYAAYVMRGIEPRRRGAAFGGILAAFDIGIGTGSIATGFLVHRYGFAKAFGAAALLSALSLPYFLYAERRFLGRSAAAANSVGS